MFLIFAYVFVAFTVTVFVSLLWLGWQHRQEERRKDG
jgi:hypothetical protein